MIRCVNLDWLEVCCLESTVVPRNPDYFIQQGYDVELRGYGTRQYAQMFTILEHGLPLYEVRRDPLSKRSMRGIFPDEMCHIRLSNRVCYSLAPARNLHKFLMQHGYTIKTISRFDICLDLQKFDTGLLPTTFVARYMAGEYGKMHQAKLSAYGTENKEPTAKQLSWTVSAHGEDTWSARTWNSLKWGSPCSAITTKFYNKTMELDRVGHDKPYIRQYWDGAGLNATANDGSLLDTWRIEFSIKSSKRFQVEKDVGEMLEITLDSLLTREQLCYQFFSFASEYFWFKKKTKTRNGTFQRKDRCPNLILFKDVEHYQIYEPLTVTKTKATDRTLRLLIKKLQEIAESTDNFGTQHEVKKSCAIIIQYIKAFYNTNQISQEYVDTLWEWVNNKPAENIRLLPEPNWDAIEKLWAHNRDTWN